jgi:hypothetical protein
MKIKKKKSTVQKTSKKKSKKPSPSTWRYVIDAVLMCTGVFLFSQKHRRWGFLFFGLGAGDLLLGYFGLGDLSIVNGLGGLLILGTSVINRVTTAIMVVSGNDNN